MIEVGDHVTVGGSVRVHWVVEAINAHAGVTVLCSGLSGVHRWERLDRLTPFKKGNA